MLEMTRSQSTLPIQCTSLKNPLVHLLTCHPENWLDTVPCAKCPQTQRYRLSMPKGKALLRTPCSWTSSLAGERSAVPGPLPAAGKDMEWLCRARSHELDENEDKGERRHADIHPVCPRSQTTR